MTKMGGTLESLGFFCSHWCWCWVPKRVHPCVPCWIVGAVANIQMAKDEMVEIQTNWDVTLHYRSISHGCMHLNLNLYIYPHHGLKCQDYIIHICIYTYVHIYIYICHVSVIFIDILIVLVCFQQKLYNMTFFVCSNLTARAKPINFHWGNHVKINNWEGAICNKTIKFSFEMKVLQNFKGAFQNLSHRHYLAGVFIGPGLSSPGWKGVGPSLSI